jgi:hypothetical protein
MKKDGRGGRQEDASRKPLLPQEERWAIGSACAHLHRGERRIEIVAEVAEVASKTYGISLKIDYVDQCWKEFRALERKLAEDIGH